ncbi:hypothetical protein ES703_109415 [subsurface metagenome]
MIVHSILTQNVRPERPHILFLCFYFKLDTRQSGKQSQPGIRQDLPIVTRGNQVNSFIIANFGHFPDSLPNHSKAFYRQPETGQSVIEVWVGTTVADDNLRFEFLDYGLDDGLKNQLVRIITGINWQWDIDGKAFTLSGTNLISEAGSRVERSGVLVQVNEQDPLVFIKVLTGPVAGMGISIQY